MRKKPRAVAAGAVLLGTSRLQPYVFGGSNTGRSNRVGAK
jgi:hypothetical protein